MDDRVRKVKERLVGFAGGDENRLALGNRDGVARGLNGVV